MRGGDEAPPPRLHWALSLVAAALGGLALDAATPSLGWWASAFLGTALVLAALWHQRLGVGAAAGAIAGAAFWMPQISWLTLYLGPVPWLALSGIMIAWFSLFGLVTALATRGLARLLPTSGFRVALQALVVGGTWVLREQVQGFWPYGGFAWGRLAHTQAEGPLAPLVSWLGFTGFSGVLAAACAVPVAVMFAKALPLPQLMRRGSAGAMAVLLLFLGLACIPPAPVEGVGTLTVAAVQGNSKSGIFDDRENGDVFRAHLQATEALLDRLEAEHRRVDVIVWPENSAEFDLPGEFYRQQAVRRLSERAGAPIVLGSVMPDLDGSYTNSSLVYDQAGYTGLRYDKRRPVPFAEYMPDREFFHALAPDLVDLVQLEYRAGSRPASLQIAGAQGAFSAGIAICFDIVFDDHAVAMMRGDAPGDPAEIIFAQTNNADFGRTDESAQQLQIARLRAIESGRALVNISTVGTSAVVLPDGRDEDRLAPHVSGAMVAEVPLVRGLTPALRFGAAIAAGWMILGAAGATAGAIGLVRSRNSSDTQDGDRSAARGVEV